MATRRKAPKKKTSAGKRAGAKVATDHGAQLLPLFAAITEVASTSASMSVPLSSELTAKEAALRADVVRAARTEWLALPRLSSRYLPLELAKHFADPMVGSVEKEAREVAALLFNAISRAANFYRQNRAGATEPVAPLTNTLLNFISLHLPVLVDCDVRSSDGKPAIVNIIEPAPSGWLMKLRGRVVSLFTDKLGYWRGFGLRDQPTHRTMAIVSLLAGSWPTVHPHNSPTVEDAIQAEAHAIRTQISNMKKPVA